MSFARVTCRKCGAEYESGSPCECPACGGRIEIHYDYEAIARVVSKDIMATREPGVWKYGELLPVEKGSRVTVGEGGTMLLRA